MPLSIHLIRCRPSQCGLLNYRDLRPSACVELAGHLARQRQLPRLQARYDEEESPHNTISMSEPRAPELGINSWLEDELYQQYLNDRKNVDESWKEVFETNGGSAPTRACSQRLANGSHAPQQQAMRCKRRVARPHRRSRSRTSARGRRDLDAIARRRRAHRREHERQPQHPAGNFAACDAGEGDRRESPHV